MVSSSWKFAMLIALLFAANPCIVLNAETSSVEKLPVNSSKHSSDDDIARIRFNRILHSISDKTMNTKASYSDVISGQLCYKYSR